MALKASPLPTDERAGGPNRDKALALLEAGITLAFLNEWEAPTLLGWSADATPLRSTADAQRAACQLLDRFPSLHSAVVTSILGHVLCERQPDEDDDDGDGGGDGDGDGGGRTYVVPRARGKHRVVDIVGAADAFVGGFIAARCRRLSGAQALLWGHGAGTVSTLSRGAQESMPSLPRLVDFLKDEAPMLPPHLILPDAEPPPSPPPEIKRRKSALEPRRSSFDGPEHGDDPRFGEDGGRYLFQGSLHLAVLRLDAPALTRSLLLLNPADAARALRRRDALGFTPVERAQMCHQLLDKDRATKADAGRGLCMLRLLLAGWLAIVAQDDADADADADGGGGGGGLPAREAEILGDGEWLFNEVLPEGPPAERAARAILALLKISAQREADRRESP